MLVGDRLGQGATESIRLAGPVRDVVDPGHANPAAGAALGQVGHQAGLAHAGLALDDDRRPATGRQRRRPAPRSRARSASRPTSRPTGGRHGWKPASPSSRATRIGWVWPRSSCGPRSSTSSPLRAARSVASSRRISPGWASAWIRAAVVTAGPVSDQSSVAVAAQAPATTSPVAIPIRTWSGSPPASRPRWRAPRGSRARSGPPGARRPRGRAASRTRRRPRRR